MSNITTKSATYAIADMMSKESYYNLILWTLSCAVRENNKPAIDLWFEKAYGIPSKRVLDPIIST